MLNFFLDSVNFFSFFILMLSNANIHFMYTDYGKGKNEFKTI